MAALAFKKTSLGPRLGARKPIVQAFSPTRYSYWYISDALSTVRLVVDGTGAVVASYASDEFGNQTAATGSADLRQHTYTGGLGVRDDGAALGLLYARHRYYDPSVGRWLSADPIGFDGGLNLYTYVGNRPTNAVDPSGLDFNIDGGQNYSSTWGFYSALYNAPDGSIASLSFGGHGSGVWQGIDPIDSSPQKGGISLESDGSIKLWGSAKNVGGRLDWSNSEIKGFEKLLQRKLKRDAKVTFYGCVVGKEGGLAEAWSNKFKKNHVVASPFFTYSDWGSDLARPKARPRTSPKYFSKAPWPWQVSSPGQFNEYVGGRPTKIFDAVP